MENYEFFYAAQKASFTFEADKLSFKIALKKGEIDLNKVIYFRKFDYQDYDHFIVIYKDNEGKTKKLKSFAEKSSPGLNSLILRLSEILPKKDLSNTPVNEARKLMKVGNAAKGGFWGAVAIMFIVFGFIIRRIAKETNEVLPVLFISATIIVILGGAFIFVYFKGKKESKDWE